MKNHNNIYNILGKLSALEPKPAPQKNILNELAEPAPMKDLATRLNERYLAEKDMGKHNNATTGFKALAKKAGGGEKGERIAGAQFQKMKKAGQLEENPIDARAAAAAKRAEWARAAQELTKNPDPEYAAIHAKRAKELDDLAAPKKKTWTPPAARTSTDEATAASMAEASPSKRGGKRRLQDALDDDPDMMGYHAIAALYGNRMWDNDAMGDLVHDLEQANPTPEELEYIIVNAELPGRLKSIRFTNTDDVQFGHLGETEVDEDMLSPKQKKIAGLRPPPDKIDGKDLAALRAGKKTEGSKVDQNKDGKNDWEDVKIARMKASGAMKETAEDEFAKARADKHSAEDDQWAASKGKGKGAEHVAGKAKNDKRDAKDRMWAAGKGVTEDSLESHDSGEYDREGEMASQDLETAEDAAEELRSILDADENLPEWVQAKITKAVDYLDTARDYMQSKDQEPDLQEGWDDMMKSVKDRSEQGTGKFDVQKTSTGTRYTRKSSTFSDDSDDSDSKASDAPKKKGRPKKNTGPERTTSKAWKHKGGRVSETKQPVKLDTFVEDTMAELDAILITEKAVSQQQQKFMGMVHAMQKGEKVKGASKELKKTAASMSKKDAEDFASTKHKGLPKKVTEGVLLENTLQAIEHRYGKEVRDFMETGDMHDDLYHALYDYYFDDMPYRTKKAHDQDPYEWVSERFYDEMGGAGYLNRKDKSDGVEESGALHPGQVVYYRGKPGKIDRIEGNKCFVHVGGGDMDVWPTNSCSTEKQSFMSTMKNDIKDIGHGMKGFLTGGPEERELDELAKLAGLGQHKLGEAACNMTAEGEMCPKHGMAECWSSGGGMMESKGGKPDFLDMDKDGDKEEPMKKAIGDKKKNPFGNKKEELDECGMPGPMSPMGGPEAESGMNISGSMDTKTGRKTLTVTADGEAAEELAQMLKMAGVVGHDEMHGGMEEPEAHATGKIVLVNPHASMMGEAYANEPNEEYANTETITDQGADLNRKKKQYKHSYKQSDNPEAIEETVKLERKLQSLYDSLKVKK